MTITNLWILISIILIWSTWFNLTFGLLGLGWFVGGICWFVWSSR